MDMQLRRKRKKRRPKKNTTNSDFIWDVESDDEIDFTVELDDEEYQLEPKNTVQNKSVGDKCKIIENVKKKFQLKKKHGCDQCEKSFNHSGALAIHRKIHEEDPYPQPKDFIVDEQKPLAKKTDSKKSHVNVNQDKEEAEKLEEKQPHSEKVKKTRVSQKKIYDCNLCELKFSNTNNLERHVAARHDKEQDLTCRQCHKTFTQHSTLLKHQIVHTDVFPYACSTCGKKFKWAKVLKVHERIHTGEKDYVCNICSKSFSTSTNLSNHLKIHSDQRTHKCSFCEKAFKDYSTMKRHEKIHKEDSIKEECEYCGKLFRDRTNLKMHRRIHTGEKPYLCSHCGRAFAQKCTLTAHVRTHTGESPFQCSGCGALFKQSSNLKLHLKTYACAATDKTGDVANGVEVSSLKIIDTPSKNSQVATKSTDQKVNKSKLINQNSSPAIRRKYMKFNNHNNDSEITLDNPNKHTPKEMSSAQHNKQCRGTTTKEDSASEVYFRCKDGSLRKFGTGEMINRDNKAKGQLMTIIIQPDFNSVSIPEGEICEYQHGVLKCE